MKVLVFDIWGEYAHYKKIYATTSAVSYCLPPKTSLYGYVGAILGLEKNQYLNYFQNKECLIGIQLLNPIVMQRININLRAVLGRMKQTDNRKPTMMEFVYQPKYRIYFYHKNLETYNRLKESLIEKCAVYTPSMGLASLISNFEFIDELDATLIRTSNQSVKIDSVVPKSQFQKFDIDALGKYRTEIIEQSMYSVEIDLERNVTEREDIILERKTKSIYAFLNQYYQLSDGTNISLF